jgi:hypothetical protein
MTRGQRVRGGAAAEQRLIDALKILIELLQQSKRWGLQDPRLAVENANDGLAVANETLAFVEDDLHKILIRRDQAAEDDLRKRIEELEAWRAAIERGERTPLALRRKES